MTRKFVFSCCGKTECDGCCGGSELVPEKTTSEKVAEIQQQPFWRRAMTAQLHRPSWDPNQSFLRNLGANVYQTQQRGKDMIAGKRQALDLRAAMEPGFAMRRLQHYWRHGDPVVTDPADKLLLDYSSTWR